MISRYINFLFYSVLFSHVVRWWQIWIDDETWRKFLSFLLLSVAKIFIRRLRNTGALFAGFRSFTGTKLFASSPLCCSIFTLVLTGTVEGSKKHFFRDGRQLEAQEFFLQLMLDACVHVWCCWVLRGLCDDVYVLYSSCSATLCTPRQSVDVTRDVARRARIHRFDWSVVFLLPTSLGCNRFCCQKCHFSFVKKYKFRQRFCTNSEFCQFFATRKWGPFSSV